MPSKDAIKAQLCIDSATNNHPGNYPLQSFIEWINHQHNKEVLRQLEQIQRELHADEEAWREAARYGDVTKELARVARWCSYCAQVLSYYRGIANR